ncbi:MAG: hypothetical protein KUG80_03590 [Gammaproteobacteria bacterium]|nr:hypothetical protein [Gammaproteobacteria bacterium]
MKRLTRTLIYFGILNLFSLQVCAANSPKNNKAWHNPTPTLASLGIETDQLVNILNGGQFLLIHNEKQISYKKKQELNNYNARFVTCATLINAPFDEVKQTLRNFNQYQHFIPNVKKLHVRQLSSKIKVADYIMAPKIPLASAKLHYIMEYTLDDSGGIHWRALDGDLNAALGRWELFPINDSQTMAVLTTWAQLQNLGMVLGKIMSAQPDLRTMAPAMQASLQVRGTRDYIETKFGTAIPTKVVTQNSPAPSIAARHSESLNNLSTRGTLLFVHPVEKVKNKQGFLQRQYISAGKKIHHSAQSIIPLSSNFNNYPLFFHQYDHVKMKPHKDGMETDWHIKVGLGIFSISLDYTLDYHWQSPSSLSFQLTTGDIEEIKGRWEWLSTVNDETLLFYTTTLSVGNDAPFILRLASDIPNYQTYSGIFMSTSMVEKQSTWLSKQLNKSE